VKTLVKNKFDIKLEWRVRRDEITTFLSVTVNLHMLLHCTV